MDHLSDPYGTSMFLWSYGSISGNKRNVLFHVQLGRKLHPFLRLGIPPQLCHTISILDCCSWFTVWMGYRGFSLEWREGFLSAFLLCSDPLNSQMHESGTQLLSGHMMHQDTLGQLQQARARDKTFLSRKLWLGKTSRGDFICTEDPLPLKKA